MTEEWRDILGFENLYSVSNLGRVMGRFGILKQGKNPKGYAKVSLSKRGVVSTHAVHVLVCTAFYGPRPYGFDACHKDGDKTNNNANNLSWKTHQENEQDKILHGTIAAGIRNGKYTKPEKTPRGERANKSSLTDNDIIKIRSMYDTELYSTRHLAKLYGVSKTSISLIIKRKTWTHI